jgi:ribonuclease VapC
MSDLYVLDASAVLAFLRDEPGGERVERNLGQSIISAVNLSEIAAKLSDFGMPAAEVAGALRELGETSGAFDANQALIAGAMRKETRSKGLSLGDRACLALAKTTSRIALTTDRVWADLDVGVTIEVIR